MPNAEPAAVIAAYLAAAYTRLDGLVLAHEVCGPEGREVIMGHIQREFADLEAVLILAELLGAR